MMADHFIDDEAQELLGEVGIELRVGGKLAQPRDLAFLAGRIGGGKVAPRLVFAHGLGDLEAFSQHEDEGGVDIVDALTITGELVHASPLRG